MLIDARTLPRDHSVEADVCIIGAGPAGIVMARELAGGPLRVALLESGGVAPDAATQALYRGRVVGHAYFRLDDCRVRRFGGSANRWGGWTRAMDPIDFEPRDWVSESGWPFPFAELDRFAARTQAALRVPSPADALRDALERGGRRLLPLDKAQVETGVLQFSPLINFGAAYRDALFAMPNVDTILHANVTAIETGALTGAIERLRVQTLAGNAFTVRSQVFVLATGAIENARLLLASRLGNEHDLVGRYFSEHLHVRCGVLVANPGVDCSFYDEHSRRGREPMGWFVLPPRVVRERRLLAFSASLRQTRPAPARWLVAKQSPAYSAGRALVESLVRGRGDPHWGERLPQLLRSPADVLRGVAARSSGLPFDARVFEVLVRAEQAPNRDSRVVLHPARRDRFGMPTVDLDWRIRDEDRASVRTGVTLLADAFAAAGLGTLYVPPYGNDVPTLDTIAGGWHQMGTTRMARDPRQGVVDEYGRVHGLANLFVAGSSVFPMCGFANPTHTLVALALRLADHIRSRIAAAPPTVVAAFSPT